MRSRIGTLVVAMALACGPKGPDADTAGETGGTTTAGTTTVEMSTAGVTTDAVTTAQGTTTTSPTTGEGGSTTGGASCGLPPLPEDALPELAFGVFGAEFEMQPGDIRSLAIGRLQCCYFLEPVEACVAYSVEPDDGGASIGPETGVLTISADAAPGSVYTVTADVEDGRAVLQAKVYVWTPESNPLVGVWHEIAELPCGGGAEAPPFKPIEELWVHASGQLSVTWTPFEVYIDYWGTYAFDLMTGDLSLADLQGNYVPDDVDAAGTFMMDGSQLVLKDMWLGSPEGFPLTPACGHRFAR